MERPYRQFGNGLVSLGVGKLYWGQFAWEAKRELTRYSDKEYGFSVI